MSRPPLPRPARRPAHAAERRSAPRVDFGVPALLDAHTSWQSTRCNDLSVGGLRVTTDHPLSQGTVVDLYFELPCRVAIEAQAQVVRTEPGAMALRFLAMDRESSAAVRAHCRLARSRRWRERGRNPNVSSSPAKPPPLPRALPEPPDESGIFSLQGS